MGGACGPTGSTLVSGVMFLGVSAVFGFASGGNYRRSSPGYERGGLLLRRSQLLANFRKRGKIFAVSLFINNFHFRAALAPYWPPGHKKKPLPKGRGEFKQGGFTSGRRRGHPGGWAVPGSRLGGPELSGTLSGNWSLMLQRNIA